MIIQDTSKAVPHLLGTRVASRLEHPVTQELVLSHMLLSFQDTSKVGLCLLGMWVSGNWTCHTYVFL